MGAKVSGRVEPAIDLGPNPGLQRALNANEQAIRGLRSEHGRVFDANGNALVSKAGSRTRIGWNKAEMARMRGATATHNHPYDVGFSAQDLHMLMTSGAAELRAVTATTRYSARPPANGWGQHTGRSVEFLYNFLARGYKTQYANAMRAGTMNEQQANEALIHRVLTDIAASTGMQYTRESW